MARRKIREYDAKRIIADNIGDYSAIPLNNYSVLITPETDLELLPQEHPWLLHSRLVLKPDQLFGQRKKHNLVWLNITWEKAQELLQNHLNREKTIGKATDKLTHFLIEPFIPHDEEYYVAFTSERKSDIIHFSPQGGIDVEEHWHSIKQIVIPTLGTVEGSLLEQEIAADIPEERRELIFNFIKALYKLYVELDFSYLEINPFALDKNNNLILLDAVAEVDDCATFKNHQKWKDIEFPAPFGRKSSPEERYIAAIDENSGASLKLTIFNPNGRIWNILSGGGASIIYLDTIVNLGIGKEIANYGEYSGNPTTGESYQYAKTILDLMTRESHPEGKILIIGGAIANFTDIEKTFLGICRALEEYQEKLQKSKVSIVVRRGGPNFEKGLKLIEETGRKINIPLRVYGPETPMVSIIPLALEGLE